MEFFGDGDSLIWIGKRRKMEERGEKESSGVSPSQKTTGFVQTFQSMRRSYLWNEKQNSDLWIQVDSKMNRFVGSKDEIEYFENLRLYNDDAMRKRTLFR